MLEGETLLVFADDWGVHPSSAQHLLRRFLSGNHVIWVNTIGLRLPHLSFRDLGKLRRKARHWAGINGKLTAATPSEASPQVRELPLAPLVFGRPARWLNTRILQRAVCSWLRATSTKPFIVSTLPLTADLVGAVPGATFVYYVVDDYAEWPGLGGRLVRQMDVEQARGADLIVAASHALADLHGQQAPGRVAYLPHGVDVAHFGAARQQRAARRDRNQPPLADVVFFGALDERIDQQLLAAVVAARPRLRFLIGGPPPTVRDCLRAADNLKFHEAVPYAELPALLAQCEVAILPYVRGEFGDRLSPLKAREALAAGLPVVGTDIPELRTLSRGVYLGTSAEEIGAALDKALAASAALPTLDELACDSWEARAERLSELLLAVRAGRSTS